MTAFAGAIDHGDDALYNSRIIRVFLSYIEARYPEVDIEELLKYAGMTNYELADQGHWFSQAQVDRFYDFLLQKTQNPDIAREAGRYAASSQGSGALRQYALGFVNPASAYWMLEKIASNMSRAFTIKTQRIGPEKVEVTVTPKPGVSEKPYQCENRLGMFEALAKLFTHKFASVEHPACLHRGDKVGRYIITWERTPSLVLKRLRNYLALVSIGGCITLGLVTPSSLLVPLVFLCLSLVLGVSFYAERLENKELERNIESQGNAANELLDQINIRYNDALLVKEIGQATSVLSDIQKVLASVLEAMEKRLEFDRGGIWLVNSTKDRLIYNVGYGYNEALETFLRETEFNLNNPESKGVAVLSFHKQRPFLVNDVTMIEKDLTRKSQEFVRRIGSQSFICVPIVYEGASLGVLLVDNVRSKKPLSQSDMSLLMGIAPQIGISIHNAMSYQRLQESKEREQNLRKLFEKYVPAPIIRRYLDSREMDLFRGEEATITAMFLDIRGFTSSSEAMGARAVVSFLNLCFEKCSLIISQKKGHINKYTGDGFLAIFGAPETLEAHTKLAFDAACDILKVCSSFSLGGKPMEIGIGLHTGRAVLGNIGSQTKIEYTAVGDMVNTTARLQEFTKIFSGFPLIMSRDAWKKLEGHPCHSRIKNLGKQNIRGKKDLLEAFGYSPWNAQVSPPAPGREGFLPLQRIKGL